ncbi:TetR family transcriptional regulator [Ktedonobacter sp. SOSP1-52]|uniref:TetR/AcrR family transcriptional regulator n=1 Tax=Ktedonobacter sp. SOSP1-52 TaxID=2778366 RepID=UPI0019169CC8|nr:TetR/AcrR family transcriptional regulator [Ktedonobacter sp. SOSP1-52]GHO65368.1 TetR family transcriptional regulator [Ktedonobacter sp. SOSP1-52]
MATQKRHVDRRVQRTREVLQQAFKDAIREKGHTTTGIRGTEKGFLALSIQDVTERANVNRGTFYLHFADKYMLADAVAREQFCLMLTEALPVTAAWDRKSLRLLILALLESFEQKYHHQQHSSHVLAPLLERATHEELTHLLFTWLKQRRGASAQEATRLETTARIVSWSILGPAIQWSQEELVLPREEMADAILLIIMNGTVDL